MRNEPAERGVDLSAPTDSYRNAEIVEPAFMCAIPLRSLVRSVVVPLANVRALGRHARRVSVASLLPRLRRCGRRRVPAQDPFRDSSYSIASCLRPVGRVVVLCLEPVISRTSSSPPDESRPDTKISRAASSVKVRLGSPRGRTLAHPGVQLRHQSGRSGGARRLSGGRLPAEIGSVRDYEPASAGTNWAALIVPQPVASL
jgi:hypothetical protein